MIVGDLLLVGDHVVERRALRGFRRHEQLADVLARE